MHRAGCWAWHWICVSPCGRAGQLAEHGRTRSRRADRHVCLCSGLSVVSDSGRWPAQAADLGCSAIPWTGMHALSGRQAGHGACCAGALSACGGERGAVGPQQGQRDAPSAGLVAGHLAHPPVHHALRGRPGALPPALPVCPQTHHCLLQLEPALGNKQGHACCGMHLFQPAQADRDCPMRGVLGSLPSKRRSGGLSAAEGMTTVQPCPSATPALQSSAACLGSTALFSRCSQASVTRRPVSRTCVTGQPVCCRGG